MIAVFFMGVQLFNHYSAWMGITICAISVTTLVNILYNKIKTK